MALTKPFKILILLLCTTHYLMGQSHVITEFKEANEPSSSFFFYPSTLRMLNLDRDPNFDDMVRDVKKARWMLFDTAIVKEPVVACLNLERQIAENGYEKLVEMNEKDGKYFVYVLEDNGKNTGTIALFARDQELGILEVIGKINLTAIRKLATSDFKMDKITELIEGTDFRLARKRKQAQTND